MDNIDGSTFSSGKESGEVTTLCEVLWGRWVFEPHADTERSDQVVFRLQIFRSQTCGLFPEGARRVK